MSNFIVFILRNLNEIAEATSPAFSTNFVVKKSKKQVANVTSVSNVYQIFFNNATLELVKSGLSSET